MKAGDVGQYTIMTRIYICAREDDMEGAQGIIHSTHGTVVQYVQDCTPYYSMCSN